MIIHIYDDKHDYIYLYIYIEAADAEKAGAPSR